MCNVGCNSSTGGPSTRTECSVADVSDGVLESNESSKASVNAMSSEAESVSGTATIVFGMRGRGTDVCLLVTPSGGGDG